MNITENIEEWKKLYESTIDQESKKDIIENDEEIDEIVDVTDIDDIDDEDDGGEDDEEQTSNKKKVFVEYTELYYIPRETENPMDHIIFFEDWFSPETNGLGGQYKECDKNFKEFRTMEAAKKWIETRVDELGKKYNEITPEGFTTIKDDDIPQSITKVDKDAIGFVYNYIPFSLDDIKKEFNRGVKRQITDGKEVHSAPEWAKILGISYHQFDIAFKKGSIKVRKDADGNKIEPRVIDCSNFRYADEYEGRQTQSKQVGPNDKVIRKFMYFIYTSTSKINHRSGIELMTRVIYQLNDPDYFKKKKAAVEKIKAYKRLLKDATKNINDYFEKHKEEFNDDGSGDEWRKNNTDSEEANQYAQDHDGDIYDLGNVTQDDIDIATGKKQDIEDRASNNDTEEETPDISDDVEDVDNNDDAFSSDDDYDDNSSDDDEDDEDDGINKGGDHDYGFDRMSGSDNSDRDYEKIDKFLDKLVIDNHTNGTKKWGAVIYRDEDSRVTTKTFPNEAKAREYAQKVMRDVYSIELYDEEGEKDSERMFG